MQENYTLKNFIYKFRILLVFTKIALLLILPNFFDSIYFNQITQLILISYLIFSFFTIWLSEKLDIYELKLFEVFCLIFVWIRVFQYLILPETIIFPGKVLSVDNINIGLLRFFLFCIVFYLGILLTYIYFKRKKAVQNTFTISPKGIDFFAVTFLLIFVCIFDVYLWSNPNEMIFLRKHTSTNDFPIIFKIFSTITDEKLTLLFLFSIFHFYVLKISNRSFILLSILIVLITLLVTFSHLLIGTRSTFLLMFWMAVILIFLKTNNKTFFLYVFIVILNLIFVVSFLDFAMFVRSNNFNIFLALQQYVSPEFELYPNSENIPQPSFFVHMLNRLGIVDYFITVESIKAQETCVNTYYNFDYYSKNFINFILPGNPFPENIISTSNSFMRCWGNPSEFALQHYKSEHVSLNGLINTIYPFFGPLIIFLVGVFYGLISNLLQRSSNYFLNLLFIIWLFNLHNFSHELMGIDHALSGLVINVLSFLSVLVSIYFFRLIHKYFKYNVKV